MASTSEEVVAEGDPSQDTIRAEPHVEAENGEENQEQSGEGEGENVAEKDPDEGYDIVQGTVVEGEDGQFFVAIDDITENDVVDMQDCVNIELHTNEDGSTEMIFTLDPPADEIRSQHHIIRPNYIEEMPNEPSTSHRKPRERTVVRETEDGRFELLAIDEDMDGDMEIGAVQTAETDEMMLTSDLPYPQGMKIRRNRVYGSCRCPECGQTFVNTARLERHLAVHQVFGSFLCPLCGKTYKYEYNLFYHWRRTCRDLNELLGGTDDRRNMDVNALRSLVDEVAQKKAEIGPIDIGISRSLLFQNGPQAKLEAPQNPLGRRGSACRACGVVILSSHMARHLQIHRGELPVDERSVCGGYFCDLCGLMFRQYSNLIKHWRTGCPEIQANLPDDIELTLDDQQLKTMVQDLIKRAVTQDIDENDINVAGNMQRKGAMMYKTADGQNMLDFEDPNGDDDRWAEEQGLVFADDFVDEDMMLVSNDGQFSVLSSGQEKSKWSMGGGAVQCPECFRTFANMGRLERHLAGFHASYGAHHCMLCGNRFKYDYNLLYHYRKSCPYTKAFFDKDVREQMDAQSLRKMVRSLAQKEVRLTPQLGCSARLLNLKCNGTSNDEQMRRQMLKVPNQNGHQAPAQLMVQKPGMDGKPCPMCSIVFYGNALERHMRAAHSTEYIDWVNAEEYQEEPPPVEYEEEDMDDEPPPQLEPEAPGEAPAPLEPADPLVHGLDMHEHEEHAVRGDVAGTSAQTGGYVQLQQEDGTIVQGLALAEMERIQQMLDAGEIQDGETVVLLENEDDLPAEYSLSGSGLGIQDVTSNLPMVLTRPAPVPREELLKHRRRGHRPDPHVDIARRHETLTAQELQTLQAQLAASNQDEGFVYQDAEGNIIHPDDIDPNAQIEELYVTMEELGEGAMLVEDEKLVHMLIDGSHVMSQDDDDNSHVVNEDEHVQHYEEHVPGQKPPLQRGQTEVEIRNSSGALTNADQNDDSLLEADFLSRKRPNTTMNAGNASSLHLNHQNNPNWKNRRYQ